MTDPGVKDELLPPSPVRRVDRRRVLRALTPLQWLEVAAAIAVVIAITPSLIRRFGSPAVPRVSTSIASVAANDRVVPILHSPIWAATVGNGEGPLSRDARAVRLGAAIASLELRYRRADSSLASSATEVAAMLDAFPGSATAADSYRELTSSTLAGDSGLRSAARLAEQVAGARVVRLGAWLQGARFAAAAGDSAYFSANAIRDVSRAAITIDASAETESAARQFEEIARARPHDWIALGTAAEELLRLLGSP